jgi:hypothetical protein
MAKGGRRWLLSLGDKFDLIQERLRQDGIRNKAAPVSELSYLSLGELVHIVFDELWVKHFAIVFDYKKGYKRALLNELTPLRNKVAHFREISKADHFNLTGAAECIATLSEYYSLPAHTSAYLPADPYWIAENIDQDQEHLLVSKLEEHHLEKIWDEYSAFESVKSTGLRPGAGIYAGHFFIEIYSCEDDGLAWNLSNWYGYHHDTVTFIRCGKAITRIFWPLAISATEITKDIRSLQRVLISRHLKSVSTEESLPMFCDGLGLSKNQEKFIGVAF